ncbi:MAG: PIN domain-containing protein [ANME-2 cluster archaeon]|nr:MAG: PIN domain-containing protein [ANME-2 cluster archaeon]
MRGSMAVFIDTGGFMAYRNTKDVHHTEADNLIRRALKREFGTVFTSDYIYDEALTLAVVRTGNKNVAKDISDVIRSPRIEMIINDEAILIQADELFFKLFDKRISFTDATTMAIMQHNNIEKIITFDAHFKGMFDVMTI